MSDSYLARVLSRDAFWALAASMDGRTVGGLTATRTADAGGNVRSLRLRYRGGLRLPAARHRSHAEASHPVVPFPVEGEKARVGWRAVDRSVTIGLSDTGLGGKHRACSAYPSR